MHYHIISGSKNQNGNSVSFFESGFLLKVKNRLITSYYTHNYILHIYILSF